MAHETVSLESAIDWGVVSRPLPGEDVCGDLHLVKAVTGGVLLAVVDGLGHGNEAIAAAQAALAILERYEEEPPNALFKRCHEALTQMRGVVMTVARLHSRESRLTWLGVGNVEAVLLRAGSPATTPAERVLLRSGIVGFHLPALRSNAVTIAPDDLLIFATDGITAGFTEAVFHRQAPQHIAERVLERHFKGSDDGLVLVARYLGCGHE